MSRLLRPQRLILIGSPGCGKKLLAQALIQQFPEHYSIVLSSETLAKSLVIDCDFIIFFLDVTNKRSYEMLIESLEHLPSLHMTLRYCLILAHFGDKSKYAFSESAIDEISRAFPDLTVFTAGNDTSELVFPVSALIRSSCYSSSCFNRTLDVEGDQFWFCSASYDC